MGTDLTRTITLDPNVGEGAACRMHQQDWGVPVRIGATGEAALVLPLGGSA